MNDAGNGARSYPAPWNLKGKGTILLYKFPKEFAVKEGRIPAFLQDSFAGGLGAVMIVDYAESNAGPYGELLFMPGKFRFEGKRLNCITKIYVSTTESVVNGWRNWAIPKERADFFASQENRRTEEVVVQKNGEPVFDVVLQYGGPSFPMDTRLMPFPLVQEREGSLYYTNFTGRGRAQFARIERIRVNPELFPGIDPYRPLLGIHIEDLAVTFPPARVTGMPDGSSVPSATATAKAW